MFEKIGSSNNKINESNGKYVSQASTMVLQNGLYLHNPANFIL